MSVFIIINPRKSHVVRFYSVFFFTIPCFICRLRLSLGSLPVDDFGKKITKAFVRNMTNVWGWE